MKEADFKNIFEGAAAELGLSEYTLTLSMQGYRELTGRYPYLKNRHSGECNFIHKVIYIWPHFYVDGVDEMDEDLARAAIYHELTHAKHPRMGELRVGEVSRAHVWPHLRKR